MTNNIKQERRYRRTEALILNGLTTLLQQKSIKEITVRELADLVDINRSTFYLHYTDIYDLLEKTEQRLLQQLMDAVNENWTLPETPKNFFAFLEQTFNILSENNFVDLKERRAKALYESDKNNAKRCSHENSAVKELYDEFLGEPGSHKAHEILHTTYVARKKYD